MSFLAELWLPILVSSVLVFAVSSILHMVLPYHRSEYQKLPGEDGVLTAMRTAPPAPGSYMFPCASNYKDASTPEMTAKFEQGPVGFMTVLPSGKPSMGPSLVQWFVYSLIISIFAAYITNLAAAPGTHYLTVFRIAGSVATLGYAVTHVPDSIWKGQRWSNTLKHVFDGVIYGLVTAGVFGWLWPS
jgi:hypothetical protein